MFTAVVMSPLNLSNIRATAVLGDHLGVVPAGGLVDSEQLHLLSSLRGKLYLVIRSFIEAQQSEG